MEAAPANVISYLDGSKQGVIPLFQRPYSWGPKDWNTLWDDIMNHYDEEDRSSHFMGAIVTVPVRSVPVGVAKHLVIDGQQRLTTVSILLAAVRDSARQQGDEPTAGIIGDFLVNRHYPPPDDLKLVPTQVDREAYKALVAGAELEEFGETGIVQAYEFFRKKLGEQDAEEKPLSPQRVLQTIQQSLQVVMINLGESDDPYLIFESLNHKGKPLNQADLVRNYVLMRFHHSTSAGGEQEVAYEKLWRPMESSLQSSVAEFLRHYGMREGRNVRKGDIYNASKAEFEKLRSVDEVRAQLEEMKEAACTYKTFIEPAEEEDERLSKLLQGMQELDSTVFSPLLLRLSGMFRRGGVPKAALCESLDILESFYVRRLVSGVPTNGLNKITLELCTSLPEEAPQAWLRDRLLQGSGGRRWPTDQEFFEALLQQRLYPRRRIARYILIALEEALKHKEPVDPESATIEHIMPQTLTAEWRADLGHEHAAVHERWLDTLGNLTLTGYNPELGNLPFVEKKAKLKNTHFELTRPILEHDVWTAERIEERGRALAEQAVGRWRRD